MIWGFILLSLGAKFKQECAWARNSHGLGPLPGPEDTLGEGNYGPAIIRLATTEDAGHPGFPKSTRRLWCTFASLIALPCAVDIQISWQNANGVIDSIIAWKRHWGANATCVQMKLDGLCFRTALNEEALSATAAESAFSIAATFHDHARTIHSVRAL